MYGVFDGNGHSITGMSIVSNFDDNDVYLGLFKQMSGVVMNLNMNSVLIMSRLIGTTSRYSYIGAFAGQSSYSVFINCHIDSNSTVSFMNETGGYACIGGFLGNTSLTTVINCSNKANTIGNGNIGGFCGELHTYNGYNSTFDSFINSGTIKGDSNASGIVGYHQCYTTGKLVINNSKNTGNITGYYAFVIGGNVSIYNSYNTGSANGNYNCLLAYESSNIYSSISIGNKYPNEVLPMTDVVYTFETNGGSQIENITGTIIELPIPTKEGYLFYGWYENEDLSGDKIDSAYYYSKDNCTLYAKYYKIVSLNEVSNIVSFEGYSQYASIDGNSIIVDIPEDTDYNRYTCIYIRPNKTMIIHFNSEYLFTRNSYANFYYYLVKDYNSNGLNYSEEYTLTLNPGDYIRLDVQQQNYGTAMFAITDIVIAVEETE